MLTEDEKKIARDAIRHSDYHGDEEVEELVRRYNTMVAQEAAKTPKRKWQLDKARAVNVQRHTGRPITEEHRAKLRAAWVRRKEREETENKAMR